jgi:mevalonate kinase
MEEAVKSALKTKLFKPTGGGGGGCISSGLSYQTDNNGTVFVKTNDKPNV